jgi:hypothetical protein
MSRTRITRGRSTRSHLVEIALSLAAVVAIYFWLTYGGPAFLGEWIDAYWPKAG